MGRKNPSLANILSENKKGVTFMAANNNNNNNNNGTI